MLLLSVVAAAAAWVPAGAADDGAGWCTAGKPANMTCDDYAAAFGPASSPGRLGEALRCLGYRKLESPYTWAGKNDDTSAFPMAVSTNLIFENVVALDTANYVLEVDFYLELIWPEPRLAFPAGCSGDVEEYYYLERSALDLLWRPPVQLRDILHIKSVGGLGTDGVYVTLLPNGSVSAFARYVASVGCEMDFSKFPFDRQNCSVGLYLETGDNKVITMEWARRVEETPGVHLQVPMWTVGLRTGDDFFRSNYLRENNSGLAVDFLFERVNSIHLMHTFLPSIMLTFGSVLSVFVPPDLVPGRMGLCVTIFLSVISLFNGAGDNWPMTSYMKAMDIWTGGCYLMLFAALTEYCAVLALGTKAGNVTEDSSSSKDRARSNAKVAAALERTTRILLPGFFLVFNLTFWTWAIIVG